MRKRTTWFLVAMLSFLILGTNNRASRLILALCAFGSDVSGTTGLAGARSPGRSR